MIINLKVEEHIYKLVFILFYFLYLFRVRGPLSMDPTFINFLTVIYTYVIECLITLCLFSEYTYQFFYNTFAKKNVN
jgi:hypothetical protein